MTIITHPTALTFSVIITHHVAILLKYLLVVDLEIVSSGRLKLTSMASLRVTVLVETQYLMTESLMNGVSRDRLSAYNYASPVQLRGRRPECQNDSQPGPETAYPGRSPVRILDGTA